LAAGIFVGFGGVLSASVGFDMGGPMPWLPGQGLARCLTGAFGFPLTILLISITGNGSWTSDALMSSIACFKGCASWKSVLRTYFFSYIGCFVGQFLVALLTVFGKAPAIMPCIAIAQHKLELTMLQTFCRAIGGGCMICMAIFMSKISKTMSGKVLGIWFPVSTYVIADFEHCLASMYFLSVAGLKGEGGTLKQILALLVPSTFGNLLGGALLVGVGIANIPRNMQTRDECPVE
jgi:formate/nitrite transporter